MSEGTESKSAEWTVGRLLGWTAEHFRHHEVDEPRLSAEVLLAHAMGCPRIGLYTQFEQMPAAEAVAVFRDHVRRAAKHEPIAYLVGEKEFYSLPFTVGPGVLIPRPDTETVVDRALVVCAEVSDRPIHVLDFGTGSGCILIALAKQCPHVRGAGLDVSADAAAMARGNVERHEISDRVEITEHDGLLLDAAGVPDGGFHVLVSNPPYVTDADWADLPAGIRDYEPRGALAARDGLSFYRRIATDSLRLLADAGVVIVEIGAGQSAAVAEIFTSEGAFEHVGTFKGPGEVHDRVMQFVKV